MLAYLHANWKQQELEKLMTCMPAAHCLVLCCAVLCCAVLCCAVL
jgi:hypothetical protein